MFNSFFDGFISYGRADSKSFAAKLQGDLSEAGFNIWFDQNDIPLGVDFQNQIDDGIEKAHNFLYVIAPHSINSPYCLKEVLLALKRNKPIIPLLHVEEVPFETWKERNPEDTDEQWEEYQAAGKHSSFPNMHPSIGKINWIYFREGIDDYQQSLEGLIGLMHKHEDYIQKHTFFLAKALEWERNHEQTRYLLTGDERKQGNEWLLHRFKGEQAPCEPTDLHSQYICESEKNANNLMTDVFLSYSEHDEDAMRVIARRLMREGKTVWTNKTDIKSGSEFQEEINRGIERADTVIFLLSQDSLDSIYCQHELEYATELNKRLISLLVCPIDMEKVPEKWRSLQFIDIAHTSVAEKFEQGLTRMIKALQEDSVYYYQHKAILVQALKWQEQSKNASILYRGYNLKNAQSWLSLAEKHPRYPALPIHKEFIAASEAQPPDQSLDVFISYSRADTDFARKINESLQLQGKTAWFDQESIASGADFQEEINKGIKRCDNFLFIISPDSIESEYCIEEVEFADSLNKRFVTLLHCPVAEDQIPSAFSNLQWIDFKKHDGDFNANFSDLIRTLNLDRDHVKSHTKWLQRALEWQEQKQTNDMLLRGSEFSIAEAWLQVAKEEKKQPPATDLQKDFIGKSREAIEADVRKEKRQKTMLQGLLGMVSVVATIAVMVGGVALRQNQELKVSEIEAITTTTQALFALDRPLEALQNAVDAGVKLKGLGGEPDIDLIRRVEEGLRQTIYGSRAKNRISGHLAPVLNVAYSPSREFIASASVDNTVKLWKQNGELLETIAGHNDSVLAIAFSPDEKLLATAGVDRVIKLWTLDGTLITSLVGHIDQINALEFHDDGTKLISASGDKTAKLWDVETGERLVTFTGHANKVNSVKFHPTEDMVVTASQDLTLKLWNMEGDLLDTLEGHTDKITAVAFSPDGSKIASVSNDQHLKLWEVQSGKLVRDASRFQGTTGHTDAINDVKFSKDGSFLITASDDHTLRIWSSNGYLLTTLQGHSDRVTHFDIHPDNETIVSSSLDNSMFVWKWRGSDLLTALYGHSEAVTEISFDVFGEKIYSVSHDGLLKEWDWQEPKPVSSNFESDKLKTLTANTEAIQIRDADRRHISLVSLAVSPDGEVLVTGDQSGNMYIWDKSGELKTIYDAHGDDIFAIAFSPDGEQFATAGRDKVGKVWDRDGRFITPINGHTDALTDIVFSENGAFIATSSWDNSVRVWNRQGKLIFTFEGHEGSVLSVAINPEGTLMASGSGDNNVILWDLANQQQLKKIEGHTDSVYTVDFSPDGQYLASGSGDSRIKVWTAEGEFVTTFRGHQNDVLDVDFSPDGKYLASGSADNTTIIWDMNQQLGLDSLLFYACRWGEEFLEFNSRLTDKQRQLCDDVEGLPESDASPTDEEETEAYGPRRSPKV